MIEIKLETQKPDGGNSIYKEKAQKLLEEVKSLLIKESDESYIEAVKHVDMALKSLGFSEDMETEKKPEDDNDEVDDIQGMKKTKGNFMDMLDDGDHEYR